ncbi:flagellar basal body M-ring protein FliF [Pectobacterium parmentieri]|uniref:Flagellar M-ring protein n=1 Tax=Pectobacterium parmentieri TaxID=1905730 RepID=A0A0H3I5A2_PECPM|nr:flagellar basal-body MS-ring/collar protein FliF [Pectobacterium parmentieri]ACX87672.1 flagellar M-ring protein FliF [Pectobacterium parmentieri WPP163]AFI89893.1 Flagellar M-ring protein FliF [Pectobacterium parmentieri]AOR59121.1 flagellar M-ring protein FliF [Pectobacterium parmentieri]AYH01115.1 flagellar basal body M-ring protein FliF [Pectobacterium parmentieri]AYH05406.1 flagellar basal body M-ring protein FliF [Pectobacterium parmentieri]
MNASLTGSATGKNSFGEILNRLRANPKIPLLIAAAATIAIVVALTLWAKGPDYRVLYSNINDRDGGAIVSELTKLNIPYRFAENGGAIMIPAANVYETRLRLAQLGLPKGGAVGFELLDKEKFGISQFSEQINYQRALEGELSRTIETLGPVQNARVHLAIPKPSLFVREQKSPSSSVTLTLQPGRALDEGQINSIVYMVSSSVAGLPPDNVTVVDQTGRLLTQAGGSGRDMNAAQLKYSNEVEAMYQRRIESIIAPMVGMGNVHAQVTAQIDFSAREQTDEQYQPNQPPDKAAVRSQQTSQSEQKGGPNVGGVPGALTNQPAPAPTAPIATPPNNANNQAGAGQQNQNNAGGTQANANAVIQTSNVRNDATTNYEVDKTILHTKHSTGGVKRLSAAVIVNYQPPGEDGKPVALTEDQIKQIETVAREAMGFSTERGDTLNVVNTPFMDNTEGSSELPFWQKQAFFDLLMEAGRWLLVLIVAWILWRKLVRPQLRKKELQQEAALAAASLNKGNDDDVVVNLSTSEIEQQRKSQQRVSAEMQSNRIRELAENDPRVVALVIRQWMSTEL